MKTIPLTQGKVALVDDADYATVSAFKWHARRRWKGGTYYAARQAFKPGGGQNTIHLHQFLLQGVPRIDHKDGDGLNNRRENLRPATRQQNGRGHRPKPSGASSKFRGVHLNRGKWEAQINLGAKMKYLGRFSDEAAAARAYDTAAREIFGDFASLNFPKENLC